MYTLTLNLVVRHVRDAVDVQTDGRDRQTDGTDGKTGRVLFPSPVTSQSRVSRESRVSHESWVESRM